MCEARGEYSNITLYRPDDIVWVSLPSGGKAGYINVALSLGNAPPNTSFWQPIAEPQGWPSVTAVKTSAYTAALNEIVRCDPTAAAFTITLPSAASVSGASVTVKKTSSSENAVTVSAAGGQTIDGDASFVLDNPYASLTVVSDGSNWMVI